MEYTFTVIYGREYDEEKPNDKGRDITHTEKVKFSDDAVSAYNALRATEEKEDFIHMQWSNWARPLFLANRLRGSGGVRGSYQKA